MKKILLSLVLATSSLTVNATEIAPSNFFAPARLGDIRLFHEDGSFFVKKDGIKHDVNVYDIDKELRDIDQDQLAIYLGTKELDQDQLAIYWSALEELKGLDNKQKEQILINMCQGNPLGYITVGQYDNGDYIIRAKSQLLGGGGFGAFLGAVGGKFLVHAVVGGACGALGIVVTPFVGPVAGYALAAGAWGVVAPATEVASTAVALAGGIAAGVVTGPI